jgi:hypothetical protein
MTHPLSRHWDQPARDEILVDGTHACMTEATFAKLPEYSSTIPSGVYEGKMWRRHDGIFVRSYGRAPSADVLATAKWLLCWYGPSSVKDSCSINYREILLVRVQTVPA